MNKYLIAGLGNIGAEYADTRHNAGFLIADALAEKAAFLSDRYASVHRMKSRGRPVIIIKPSTYMNLSGKAVSYWMKEENIELKNTLIVTDDIALPFGTIRMRKKGSDGGHNGLTSVIETLNTTEFPRLRFGIGSEFSKGSQVDYVLGKWSDEERKLLDEHIKRAVEMIKIYIIAGIDKAMNLNT